MWAQMFLDTVSCSVGRGGVSSAAPLQNCPSLGGTHGFTVDPGMILLARGFGCFSERFQDIWLQERHANVAFLQAGGDCAGHCVGLGWVGEVVQGV